MRIHKITDDNHILNEDLTGLVTDPFEVKRYYALMNRTCVSAGGVGLAANQVGLGMNFFFVAASVKLEKGGAGVLCVNPEWRPCPDASIKCFEGEGCLSLPGKRFLVDRYTSILATWMNTQGHWRKNVKLTGLAAQVFQHEHDHLRGITLMESGREMVLEGNGKTKELDAKA